MHNEKQSYQSGNAENTLCEVISELDISYADGDNPRQCLDLYLPEDCESGSLPVIVFFHGGAWLEGNKSSGADRVKPFVRSGKYAGVSAGYRLTNEAIWPAQIYDCKAAIRWVRANADKYGLNPEKIAVWGGSAGAHLALMVGLTGSEDELEGDVGKYDDVSSDVCGVANFFGPTAIFRMAEQSSDMDHVTAQSPEGLLIGGAVPENPEKAKAASPVTYVTNDDPPVLTVHGTVDPIVPYQQAEILDRALKKAGIESYFISVKGGGHGGFPDETIERAEMFFSKILLDEKTEVVTDPIRQR